MNPKYSPERANADPEDKDFGASFADLFEENAYIEPVVSVGLSIPVYDGGKVKHQKEIDQNTYLFILKVIATVSEHHGTRTHQIRV